MGAGGKRDAARNYRGVERCPTGSLHYERTDGGAPEQPRPVNTITVSRNGPYYVRGNLEIVMPDGEILEETRASICRCGASTSMPFCDNTHRDISFRDAGQHAPEANAQDELPLNQKLRLTPNANGNLKLEGPFELRGANGQVITHDDKQWLCRCGASADKPFCDSTHKKIGFTTDAQS